MASVTRYDLRRYFDGEVLVRDDRGDWALYADIKAVVQEAYENGKKEQARLQRLADQVGYKDQQMFAKRGEG